ncbi:MAG TPA: DUF952 domain-containing protein [Pyrinomonadaceae bacterium]|nr:DUF952 domain-containing protein [Pyrinomonadaceae bacterium]
MFIYHIVLPNVWERFKGRPSYQPESLTTEGFIHCSYPGQLEAVIKRYYRGAEKILILKINTEKLFAKLVKEPSTGGEVYPHIYGRLNFNAIVDIEERILRTSNDTH